MKKLLPCLALLVLSVAGCAFPTTEYDSTPTKEVQASPTQAVPAALTATRTPKAPIITFTPTDNGQGQVIELNRQIAEAQLQLQWLNSTRTVEAMNSEDRDKTATVQHGFVVGTATATAAIGNKKATMTAAVNQTLDARAVQTQAWIDTATVQAPTTQRLQTEADWAWVWQIVYVCGVLFIIMAVVYVILLVGFQIAKYIHEKRVDLHEERQALNEPVYYPPPVVQQPAAPVSIKLDKRDEYGYGSVDFATLPISKETLSDVAELMVDGARYTQKEMTGDKKPLIKDKNFAPFGDWMCKYHIAIKLDGRYHIQHHEFFEQVLENQ